MKKILLTFSTIFIVVLVFTDCNNNILQTNVGERMISIDENNFSEYFSVNCSYTNVRQQTNGLSRIPEGVAELKINITPKQNISNVENLKVKMCIGARWLTNDGDMYYELYPTANGCTQTVNLKTAGVYSTGLESSINDTHVTSVSGNIYL